MTIEIPETLVQTKLIATLEEGKRWLKNCGYNNDWATREAATLVGYWVDNSDGDDTPEPTGELTLLLNFARHSSLTLVHDRFFPSDGTIKVWFDKEGQFWSDLDNFS